MDGCPEIVSIMQRPCYGVQSTCLVNAGMDTDPPSHMPFDKFDNGKNGSYSNDGNTYDYENDNDNNEMLRNT